VVQGIRIQQSKEADPVTSSRTHTLSLLARPEHPSRFNISLSLAHKPSPPGHRARGPGGNRPRQIQRQGRRCGRGLAVACRTRAGSVGACGTVDRVQVHSKGSSDVRFQTRNTITHGRMEAGGTVLTFMAKPDGVSPLGHSYSVLGRRPRNETAVLVTSCC